MGEQGVALETDKPGWMSRIFGLESAELVACDAIRGESGWSRGERFEFLYRGRLGRFYCLRGVRAFEQLDEARARELFARLPVRLQAELI